ncbi:MAG: hypothetical protein MR914_00150 [Clostridiales bacterium]|nr:hypothetical protein [Clostridiales bacterium]
MSTRTARKWKYASQLAICLLILISLTVAVLLARGDSAWQAIVLYWVVLTVKNVCDYIASFGMIEGGMNE